jgi:hypothetical protein
MDRTELDALVAFMLVHHPIPALPVVCGQGGGSSYRESVASSHDLLANGIRFQMTHADTYSEAQIEASTLAKTAVLEALEHDVADEVRYWKQAEGGLPAAGVERCYQIFCTAARAYQALYPGSLDMRTLPMASVCRHDVVHTQSLAHFLARDAMFLRGEAEAPMLPSASTAYSALIGASVLQLAVAGAP